MERIPGTVIFTDLVGFTEYTSVKGDEAALALIDTQEEFINGVVNGHGRIVKTLGDGLMLFFSDPCQAVEAAMAIQERFESHTRDEGLPLWIRVGLHHGRVAVRHDDLLGNDVNLAARIMGHAGPGEVLVSEAVVERVEGCSKGVAFDEMGPMLMKGIPEPVLVYTAHPTHAPALSA